MASKNSREEAKKAISIRETTDPDMENALQNAELLQLRILKENNRHAEAQIKANLGWIGGFFGGEKSAPVFVALTAMVFGFLGAGASLYMASVAKDASLAEFWGKQFERSVAFASAALAFIFGRGSSK